MKKYSTHGSDDKSSSTNNNNLLPVLIIPGFMSSGLEVQSDNHKENGKRVWLNLSSLGFYRLAKIGKTDSKDDDEFALKSKSTEDTTTINADQEYQQQMANKKSWIQYMSLSDDMCTEHVGCKVRPIPSLEGVDYLTDSKMTQLGSYVFGPLVHALKKLGYVERFNLDASPYDWRLPPSVTEERDQYLTKTMERIQRMSLQNSGTPVVLLCHSMGCKMGHYLLNFIKDHPNGGQVWIDRYIHTFVVVGAPHLGVSKTIRAEVTGDKMTLDAFLSDEDGLKLGRSLGSVPWMMPSMLPSNVNPAVLPTVIKRREGSIEIQFISDIDIKDMLKRRKKGYVPSVLRLCVIYGNETAITEYKSIPHHRGKIHFDETFIFSAPSKLNLQHPKHQGLEKIQFLLQEPGTHVIEEKDSTIKKIICCPFKWCLCCPCTLALKILQLTLRGTLMLSDQVMATLGTATTTASTGVMKLKFDSNNSSSSSSSSNSTTTNEMSFQARFMFQQDKNRTSFFGFGKRYTNVKVRIRHIPCDELNTYKAPSSLHVASLPVLKDSSMTGGSHNTPVRSLIPFPLYHRSNNETDYLPSSGLDMLKEEGLETCIQLLRSNKYENDPLGPRTRSAYDAPPVKRVHAIYGINVPTEISAVYRKRSRGIAYNDKEKLISKYVLDHSAKFDRVWKIGGNTLSGVPYELKNGILYETSRTPQRILKNSNTEEHGDHGSNRFSTTNHIGDVMMSKLTSTIGGGGSSATAATQQQQQQQQYVTRKCSGDGTVPYWNLQHCETWKSKCEEVSVDEIDGAEHREILADPRFHKILTKILIQQSVNPSFSSGDERSIITQTQQQQQGVESFHSFNPTQQDEMINSRAVPSAPSLPESAIIY